jgi:uncharacterized membrane protein
VQRNAQQSDNTILGLTQLREFAVVMMGLTVVHIVFWRLGTKPWLRFFVYYFVITGAVTLGWFWFDMRLLPQANRFQPELDMAGAGAIAYIAVDRWKRLDDRVVKGIVVAAFALVCMLQVRNYARFTNAHVGPIDVQSTIEYKMSKAFEQYGGGARVFAPGNVGLWMNMFNDVPQVTGCCDQGVPTFEHRVAMYAIHTGQNAGDRDVENSMLWLKAYGANAVGVTGANSTEPFKPFVHPQKFNGILKELWRDGEDVIYEVPQRSRSLAYVIGQNDVIRRAPVNGLDIEPLQPYVKALDNPGLPLARMDWTNEHQARVDAMFSPGQVLSIQETYDAGWHATVNGKPRSVTSDGLGMMIVDPQCSGPCVVDLRFDRTGERILSRAGLVIGILICLTTAIWPALRRRQRTA